MNSAPYERQKLNIEGGSRWVALHGRRDEPTDALLDYSLSLKTALAIQGIQLDQEEVSWHREGSLKAFRRLWIQSAAWKQMWILVQYTALGWSRRGFSFRVLFSLSILRLRGSRCAVIFHDPKSYGGQRVVDRIRTWMQRWIMRQSYRLAHKSIFTIPIENIDWLPGQPAKAAFIPIGANLPEIECPRQDAHSRLTGSKTVSVFSLTGGQTLTREVQDIAHAVRYASENHPNLNLLLLGRNSQDAESPMRRALKGTRVHQEFLGILSPTEISRVLVSSDVLLFVRGPISGSRSSAMAGVACGLPIVGYGGKDTAFPITEAGLELAADGSPDALGAALDRVLSDDVLRQNLRHRSAQAHTDYYCWKEIGRQFASELSHE